MSYYIQYKGVKGSVIMKSGCLSLYKSDLPGIIGKYIIEHKVNENQAPISRLEAHSTLVLLICHHYGFREKEVCGYH